MSEEVVQVSDDNELTVFDFLGVIWRFKGFIVLSTMVGIIAVFAYCFISIKLPPEKTYLPNMYKAKAEMLISNSAESNSLSSMLSSNNSLSSLLGVSSSSKGPSNSGLAQYLVTSYTIQDAIIDRFYRPEIEEKHKASVERAKAEGKDVKVDKWKFPTTKLRNQLKKKIVTEYTSSSGVFTITVEDKDPVLACDMVNYTVELLEKRFEEIGIDKNKLSASNLEKNIDIAYRNILNLQNQTKKLDYSISNSSFNENSNTSVVMDVSMLNLELSVQEQIYSTLKTQYETLKVSMASESPVFQILEYAQVPDLKSKPSRGIYCVIGAFVSFFVSILLAYLINAIKSIKADPVAMSKFKSKKVK